MVPDEEGLRRRAWEATSHLHLEPMSPGGRMVTYQPLLVEAMISFAIDEMARLVEHLNEQLGKS
jgi:hypothetical protein